MILVFGCVVIVAILVFGYVPIVHYVLQKNKCCLIMYVQIPMKSSQRVEDNLQSSGFYLGTRIKKDKRCLEKKMCLQVHRQLKLKYVGINKH